MPLALDSNDEFTNFVAAFKTCNQKQSDSPMRGFAKTISVDVEALPVHGDPVINNQELPVEIRLLRKRIYDQYRKGKLKLTGQSAQKKIEKKYRREFWQTHEGKFLELEFKNPLEPTRYYDSRDQYYCQEPEGALVAS